MKAFNLIQCARQDQGHCCITFNNKAINSVSISLNVDREKGRAHAPALIILKGHRNQERPPAPSGKSSREIRIFKWTNFPRKRSDCPPCRDSKIQRLTIPPPTFYQLFGKPLIYGAPDSDLGGSLPEGGGGILTYWLGIILIDI